MTFMNASVTSSSRRTPVLDAIAVRTAPAVQMPNASRPCSAATANTSAERGAGLLRVEQRRGGVEPVDGGDVARPPGSPGASSPGWEPAPDRAAARAAASARRAVSRSASSSSRFVEAERGVAVAHDEDLDLGVVDGGRLRRRRAREARRQRALAHDADLHGARAGQPERALGELGRGLRRRRASRHATPTWTSRKRAGAVPCETRMTWPGSPLPQLPTPHSRHSGAEQTASRRPQNVGVTPA